MSNEIVPTPEGYVCQSYDFTRIRHTLSMRYRKFLHVVMVQAQLEGKFAEVTFRVGDLVKAFGKGDHSGRAYQAFRLDTFTTGLMQEIAHVPAADGSWMKAQWVSMCYYDKTTDTLRVRLNEPLMPYVLEYRKRYVVVTLEQMNQFEGRHAWTYYEQISTKKHLAGKDGNKPGEFFFDMTIEEIRGILSIAPHEYKATAELRRRAVELPISEINHLNCGLSIEVEPHRRGKFLTGFRFLCTVYDPAKARPVKPPKPEELSKDEHIATHQKRFDELLEEARIQPDLIPYKDKYARETALYDLTYTRFCKEFPLKKRIGRPRKKAVND
jgi:plasmid replication initiation protein